MVNPLYWVSALTYAFVLGAILFHDVRMNETPGNVEQAFRKLIVWVIFFCLQDVAWGLSAGKLIQAHWVLFVTSTIFHISTVLTTFFWLKYNLTYLGDKIQYHKRYLYFDMVIITFQIIMLIINLFTPVIFYVGEDGTYCTALLRPLAFANQYVVYLVMGFAMIVLGLKEKGEDRKKYNNVFFFALSPILSGFFQFLYPDGPFYSLGYFLSCVIIHLFIVQNDRNELQKLHYEMERLENDRLMSEQKMLSQIDKLTGLYSRRAYEDDILQYPDIPIEDDFVFVSADVNGLKEVNDTLGHAAGDELLKGAAACLEQCLGAYGKIYRIGGDEFAAIIFADKEKLSFIKADLEETILKWSGDAVKKLAVSFGFVSRAEYVGIPVVELARIADKRMYQEKETFYKTKGIDRKLQKTAYNVLCTSYAKVLLINLTSDTYDVIHVEESEWLSGVQFSEKISEWFLDFGKSGQVHREDVESYLEKTDMAFLRQYFHEGKHSIHIFYKRLINGTFRHVMMEIVTAEDYREDNQSLYLYVKDIDE